VRIVEGTENPELPHAGKRHWTGGCHGTSGFLRSVLRAINIPVAHAFHAGHSLTYFPTENRHLTHGDDPYSAFFKYSKATALELLIDKSRYQQLFVNPDNAQQKLNVGIRPREIGIEYLPGYLLKIYCQDIKDGKNHEDGKINSSLRNWTAQELEAMQLWVRMDVRMLELYGGVPEKCTAIHNAD
jgi:hypothetical protein